MEEVYAIWTFDLARRDIHVNGILTRTMQADCVFWDDCKSGWSREQCEERAHRLSVRQHAVFIVRRKLSGDEWELVPPSIWNQGIASVQQRVNEQRARMRQKNLQRRISRSGMPPPREMPS
jgi:hypothetical protein